MLVDSDRQRDIARRVRAYLDGGARDVIVVDRFGWPEFWNASGRQAASLFGIILTLDQAYFEEDGNASGVQCATTDAVSGLAVAGRTRAGNGETPVVGTSGRVKSST